MRRRTAVLAIALISVILVSLFVAIEWFSNQSQSSPEFFVGVELAYGDFNDVKDLVDKVKNYTNLFVIGLPDEISLDQSLLNATCDYIYEAGLSFIIMFTSTRDYTTYVPYVWVIKAIQKYGDRFLGVYRIDEPGGTQLDGNHDRLVIDAQNYTDAARTFELLYFSLEYWLYSGAEVFTADYGLYWFDYRAGYDAVLAEFGWNFSRALHVGLCRGAARAQNRDWGAIVTWTYYNAPYIESADELYDDLVLAYDAGAKYAVVFDYPGNVTRYGILTEKHFDALERFWSYVRSNPGRHGSVEGDVAYVLPKDYGFGFRGPDDTIWGLWGSDQLSKKVWDDVNNLVGRYGSRLDVVYDDPEFSRAVVDRYGELFFWNETVT